MESVRVRLRKKRGRSWSYQEIVIPTDAEMERIAAELHSNRVSKHTTILGWNVFYFHHVPLEYKRTEVNPFTGESGETIARETTHFSYCIFGYGAEEWKVCYTWDQGDDQPPRRIQEMGDIAETERSLFDEIDDPSIGVDKSERLYEGAIQRAELSSYERNRKARNHCIEHYGVKCFVCGFDFGRVYGDVAKGFIHVHHLTPLSEIGEQHVVDPIQDLRPVCPNCHAVLHMQTPPFSITQVSQLLDRSGSA